LGFSKVNRLPAELVIASFRVMVQNKLGSSVGVTPIFPLPIYLHSLRIHVKLNFYSTQKCAHHHLSPAFSVRPSPAMYFPCPLWVPPMPMPILWAAHFDQPMTAFRVGKHCVEAMPIPHVFWRLPFAFLPPPPSSSPHPFAYSLHLPAGSRQILVGSSMGAWIALRMVQELNKKVFDNIILKKIFKMSKSFINGLN
jgi:hypothetical protein